ncbi:DUF806 family protein [Lactobacillus sp. PV037]|uniref:DUF806 family protein n=1 Tax=Lactobacillus sp. PV037 TaxID=2594496 RepID=UPI0022403C0B|nr:DUF806 family protein [Lactobacillus sp. PV037]QNQ83757.1 DUF806 family protein [Lactobacillus sp. PV037]
MATDVGTVVTLLKQNTDKFIDILPEHIHGFMVSPSDTSTDKPIILVTEVTRGRHLYGNNTPIATKKRIQLQFYYPRDYEEDIDKLETTIELFLVQKNYYCYQNAGHVITPDNQQITNTLKFNYIKEL